MQIQYINEAWKKQRSITDDMCNYSIHISKPTDKIGFYQNIPLETKYDDVVTATQKAKEVQLILNTIDSYIRVSVIEGLKNSLPTLSPNIFIKSLEGLYPTVSPTVFIGMTLEEANNAKNGWFVNPTIIDGVSVPISASLCYNRVCVEVANNKIIGIESYGS